MKQSWIKKDPEAQRLAAVEARMRSREDGHIPLLHNPDGSILQEVAAKVEVEARNTWIWIKKNTQ